LVQKSSTSISFTKDSRQRGPNNILSVPSFSTAIQVLQWRKLPLEAADLAGSNLELIPLLAVDLAGEGWRTLAGGDGEGAAGTRGRVVSATAGRGSVAAAGGNPGGSRVRGSPRAGAGWGTVGAGALAARGRTVAATRAAGWGTPGSAGVTTRAGARGWRGQGARGARRRHPAGARGHVVVTVAVVSPVVATTEASLHGVGLVPISNGVLAEVRWGTEAARGWGTKATRRWGSHAARWGRSPGAGRHGAGARVVAAWWGTARAGVEGGPRWRAQRAGEASAAGGESTVATALSRDRHKHSHNDQTLHESNKVQKL